MSNSNDDRDPNPMRFDPIGSSQNGTHSLEKTEREQVVKHKFVGRSRERERILKNAAPRPDNQLPPSSDNHSTTTKGPSTKGPGIEAPADVRRWTAILGLDHADFTQEQVYKAWRKQMASPAVHPDLGGEVETAILLNTAKDSLIKWLDSFAPKLGKQFSHLSK